MDHKDRDHALLAPSSAHRWMHCTPSAVLESKFPDTTSAAATEGTLAHEIGEAKLRHHFYTKDFNKRKLTAALTKLKKDPLYQPEMDGYTDEYKDFVHSAALAFEHTPHVVIETSLDLSDYVPGCFGTADCILIGGGVMHVIDFKYGKGVQVSAKQNEQMTLYALGAYKRYQIVYQIDKVRMSIVQPRIGNYDTWEIGVDQLMHFAAVVKDRAALAIDGAGDYVPGEWCQFCRARKECRARAEENIKLAYLVGQKPPLISNDEVGTYLRIGEDVASWLSDLKEYALGQCLAGNTVSGWKAVEGRASREWTDMEAAFERIIEAGTDEAMLYERRPLSLAQTEKLIGVKAFRDLVGDLVEKKPGKPTLVPETDKRIAITNKISAAEAFKED